MCASERGRVWCALVRGEGVVCGSERGRVWCVLV